MTANRPIRVCGVSYTVPALYFEKEGYEVFFKVLCQPLHGKLQILLSDSEVILQSSNSLKVTSRQARNWEQ